MFRPRQKGSRAPALFPLCVLRAINQEPAGPSAHCDAFRCPCGKKHEQDMGTAARPGAGATPWAGPPGRTRQSPARRMPWHCPAGPTSPAVRLMAIDRPATGAPGSRSSSGLRRAPLTHAPVLYKSLKPYQEPRSRHRKCPLGFFNLAFAYDNDSNGSGIGKNPRIPHVLPGCHPAPARMPSCGTAAGSMAPFLYCPASTIAEPCKPSPATHHVKIAGPRQRPPPA